MSRDFKNISKQDASPNPLMGYFISTVAGLAVGLLAAFLVYVYKIQPAVEAPQPPTLSTPEAASPQPEARAEPEVPEPTFDFYTILPERDVNISEWIEETPAADIPAIEATTEPDGNLYIFQVGSFEDFEAADQLKARLALVGLKADIQRVVINGQETTHRVRVGPYQEQTQIQEIRERLLDNNIEFMLLRLNAD